MTDRATAGTRLRWGEDRARTDSEGGKRMSETDFELTEEIFDKVGAPLIVAFALTSLETQIDALTDVNDQLREAFATWAPSMRDRAVSDLRHGIDDVREVLDRLESALPEVAS